MSDTNNYYDSPEAFPEEENKSNLILGIIGGAVGAVLGAAIWAAVTVITEYQIGIMAIGVGALTGLLVRALGKGESIIYGLIGAAFALIGCLLGNLFSVVFWAAGDFDMFFVILGELDFETITEVLLETFQPMDLLFYALALYQGFKIAMVTTDFHKPQVTTPGTQGNTIKGMAEDISPETQPDQNTRDNQPSEY